ncbi:DUF4258 domain-containing protein [Parasediminibacterium sp. JCM 36343]|uniref:DUF4258 domain-containing protein n=1 Tax=Parasediminibacterium sp. JCM 36343 TaxID=3374279 RepID=UPI003979B8B7
MEAKPEHKPNKLLYSYIFLFVVFIVFLIVKRCNLPESSKNIQDSTRVAPAEKGDGILRATQTPFYTKHARCRMECRHINETEVLDILKNGTVNYKKSDLAEVGCEKKYALEGYTKDHNQHVRIIVAPCDNVVTVITCIDLDHDWICDCGEDYEGSFHSELKKP